VYALMDWTWFSPMQLLALVTAACLHCELQTTHQPVYTGWLAVLPLSSVEVKGCFL
jgi:hypothetical protein